MVDGRDYCITPGLTTVSEFMKMYGLDGIFMRDGKHLRMDKLVLEVQMDPDATLFTIKNEKGKHA